MKSNAGSLVVYQHLLDDTSKEIKYWMSQPESEERTKQLQSFTIQLNKHTDNFERVKAQARDNGEDLKSDIEEVIDFLENIIKIAGAFMDDKTKTILTALINAARKLLEIFN